MSGMISVEDAHARLMGLFAPLGVEEVPLAAAGGRVLARDVVAGRDQPPFPASAMDGYAARAEDVRPGAELRVIGTSAAGAGFPGRIGAGETVRILTGAPVPDGADLVVIQEDVIRDGDVVRVGESSGGPHIRARGSDFPAGSQLAAPRRLGTREIALLAAMNVAVVPVYRRPAVALIATGDELVMPGEIPGPDQIVSSNNYGLKVMLESAGAEARLLPIARDTPESLISRFALATGADLIVTLGGASVGDHDLVQSTALAEGLELDFYKVAMRPGKPLMAGRLKGVPLIGLPGNPVSALVCGEVFVRPAVEAMQGLPGRLPQPIRARLGAPVEANANRTHYMRARVEVGRDGPVCTPLDRQDSSLLSVLADANALMVRGPGDRARAEGDMVDFIYI